MLEKDAILSKISIIKNCLDSIQRHTHGKAEALNDELEQNNFVLNLQRAVQAAIDMSNLLIAAKGWQLPNSYKMGFYVLAKEGVLSDELCERMGKMAGFRNIAVHDYQELNLDILKSILTKHMSDFDAYMAAVLKAI